MVDTRPGKLNPADVDHISEVRMVPSYPRGTVTFLLTDIEGSTALWEQSQVGMETALARHDETLRITIQQHSGSIFKTTGDGACAVFARAADALLAALDIQREITDHPASGTGPLRVRMALLTGVAEQRNDDYFGVVLNRASRLLALASGHQVLLGASTAELVWDHVPDGVELRSLGQRRLRGVKRPMEVYRVVAPYLPDDEPIREQTTSPVTDASQDGLFTRQDVSTSIRVHLLGTFRVLVNGRELTDDIWKKQKARQLLKCLLTRPHRRMTIDEAIDTFWPDAPDWDAAQKTLRSTLSALRSALGTTRAARGRGLVVTQQGAVLIPREADLWVDADAFERMLGDSRAAEDTNLLEEADALYAGDYLAGDPYESWAEERRESLRRQWVELQHSLAQAREERGDIEGAATALRRVLHTDPCDERAARALMHLLAKHGSRSESLRVFDRLVEALRGIEVEPEARTSALRDQIAAGGLEEAPVATQTLDRVAPLAPASLEDEVGPHRDDFRTRSMEPRPYVPSYPFPMPERLIGRVPELNVAENILEHGRQALQVLLLSAPAGTGKSALAGAIVRRAQRMGYLCLAGGGYEQQSVMPLGPFHDAIADYLLAAPADWIRSELGAELTDLAEIVPELRQHLHLADRSLRAPPDQAHLFGAVHTLVRMLSARWPLLICLEDLHAADAATQDLIRFLTRQAGRLPLVIVGTFRSEGV
ncbi:MAG: BTAD domain-containing putative transcriptional regulator, partial [Chloroflexota bacterium]